MPKTENQKDTEKNAGENRGKTADSSFLKILCPIAIVLICALILIMGVLFTTAANDANQLKTLSMFFIVSFLAILFFLRFAGVRQIALVRTPLMLPLFIFMIIATISFLVHPKHYFFGQITYFRWIMYALLMLVTANLVCRKWHFTTIFIVFAVTGFLCCI